jgi:hypothetical protein
MNKSLIIHVVSEAVVILLAVIVLQKQIGGLKQEVAKLNETAKQQEQQLSKCMHHIQQLYMILDQPVNMKGGYQQQPQRRMNDEEGFSHSVMPSMQQQMQPQNQQHPQNQMQQQMQQQMNQMMQQMMPPQASQIPQMPKINNMMSDIMNLVPAIMPLMSGNPANVIIAELEKAPPKEAAASVEVMDDDDPDVDEALNQPSKEEEKTEEQIEN